MTSNHIKFQAERNLPHIFQQFTMKYETAKLTGQYHKNNTTAASMAFSTLNFPEQRRSQANSRINDIRH